MRRIEIPDLSYSFNDFILGNEHCFAEDVFDPEDGQPLWRNRPKEIETCHHYEMRRASVNSTHFSPQNHAMYMRYHRLALATASQCKRIAHVLGNFSHHVQSCEREALSFEAYGSHFSADAWSTGHMWERWGSPLFAKSAKGRLRAQVVALVSGIIHGWKFVVRKYPVASLVQDDQLCMPGFFLNDLPVSQQINFFRFGSNAALEREHASAMVRWTYPPNDTTTSELFFGGGDSYLFPCTEYATFHDRFMSYAVYTRQSRWAISQSADTDHTDHWPMATQYRRMLTCMARGFEEVYASGPQTLGNVAHNPSFDPAIASVEDDRCWDMRVTNQSMRLATRISTGVLDFTDPGLLTKLVWQFLPLLGRSTSGSDVDLPSTLLEGTRFRVAMTRLGFAIRQFAHDDPNGTSTAQLAHPDLESFYGFKKNSSEQPLLNTDTISYLERQDRSQWAPTTDSAKHCTVDSECAAHEYCADRAGWGGPHSTFGKQCINQEIAVLRAFRDGEVVHFCTEDTEDDIAAAKAACIASTGIDSIACNACVQVTAPHVKLDGAPSTCERLRDAKIVLWPEKIHPITGDLSGVDLETAALSICGGTGGSNQPD